MQVSRPKHLFGLRRSPWIEALRQPVVWRRATMLGLPLGLLQVAINQGDSWWRHAVDGVVIVKTIMSPLVTISVALVSTASAYVERTSKSIPNQTNENV